MIRNSLRKGVILSTPQERKDSVVNEIILANEKEVKVIAVKSEQLLEDTNYFKSNAELVKSDIVVILDLDKLSHTDKISISHIVKNYWELTKQTILVVSENELTTYNSDLSLRTKHII